LRLQCKLNYVTRSSPLYLFAKMALMVLLTLQLVVGSFVQTARATEAVSGALGSHAGVLIPNGSALASHGLAPAANAAAHADCPMHAGAAHGSPTPTHETGTTGSPGSHDCCHASACQCHCVQTPAALDVLLTNAPARSLVLPLPSSAQFVVPRIDDFLRPPIA